MRRKLQACPVERLRGMRDVLEIQDAIIAAAKSSLERQGFLEIRPPIIASATDPGLRGAKQFEVDFYGKRWKVTSSMILQKMLAASALGKVFSISPCLRKEPLSARKTGRHLCEFWQIDVELSGASRDRAMEVAETILRDIMREIMPVVKKKLGKELKVPKLPFKRLPYKEALKLAEKLGFSIEEGKEIPWEAEKAISMQFDEPFFIVDYPTGSRGFYDKIYPKQREKLLAFDMIYPKGFGEAVSGSQREDIPELITKKLKQVGEKPRIYSWYLDLLKKSRIKPTAGFGFGLERLTRFVCGLERVEQAAPFPKLPGEVSV
ncbi:MAG: asparagine synthetase A [Candidatus Aenigmatarchaeota archaeon]